MLSRVLDAKMVIRVTMILLILTIVLLVMVVYPERNRVQLPYPCAGYSAFLDAFWDYVRVLLVGGFTLQSFNNDHCNIIMLFFFFFLAESTIDLFLEQSRVRSLSHELLSGQLSYSFCFLSECVNRTGTGYHRPVGPARLDLTGCYDWCCPQEGGNLVLCPCHFNQIHQCSFLMSMTMRYELPESGRRTTSHQRYFQLPLALSTGLSQWRWWKACSFFFFFFFFFFSSSPSPSPSHFSTCPGREKP